MKWQVRQGSENVEYRKGMSGDVKNGDTIKENL
jgi:hypothetical protein